MKRRIIIYYDKFFASRRKECLGTINSEIASVAFECTFEALSCRIGKQTESKTIAYGVTFKRNCEPLGEIEGTECLCWPKSGNFTEAKKLDFEY